MHTLQVVDIATRWIERAAVLGRGQAAMVEGFRRVQARLPFPITHLHPDNGSEFFNDHLLRYFGEAVTGQPPPQLPGPPAGTGPPALGHREASFNQWITMTTIVSIAIETTITAAPGPAPTPGTAPQRTWPPDFPPPGGCSPAVHSYLFSVHRTVRSDSDQLPDHRTLLRTPTAW